MPSSDQPEKRDALEGVSRVALRALTALVGPQDALFSGREPLESYVADMYDAVISADPGAISSVIRAMRRTVITVPQISEIYVPSVARRLGDAWLKDDLDFVKVTIGCARLQAALRRFDNDWDVPGVAPNGNPSHYLVGVPEGVQHTLGACVLAGQLRQRGLRVHLDLALTPGALAQQLGIYRYAGVLLSGSGQEHLDVLCELVDYCKGISRNTPVIIGGSILENVEDILSLTQADIATCEMNEALSFCDSRMGNAIASPMCDDSNKRLLHDASGCVGAVQ